MFYSLAFVGIVRSVIFFFLINLLASPKCKQSRSALNIHFPPLIGSRDDSVVLKCL